MSNRAFYALAAMIAACFIVTATGGPLWLLFAVAVFGALLAGLLDRQTSRL